MNTFGTLKSLAGSEKTYSLVFVQDGKIVLPNAILDAGALKAACAAKGGVADRKFVQVRRNGGGCGSSTYSIHAQLPDESSNRPYGTSFDFTDKALYEALGGTIAITPMAPAPKTAPTGFGSVKSLAGTGKDYVMVFVQDGKIITPTRILSANTLKSACALRGGVADRKFVQVRINGDSIHAQLPDESANRPYGTSFDFVDDRLAAYLRGE